MPTGKQLGVSTTSVRTVGALEGSVAPQHVAANEYLASHVKGRRFIDWQFALVMLTAILVGSVDIHGMIALGWIDGIAIKGAQLAANVADGATWGVGMALLGLCPGTAVVAAGAGARDA